MAKSKISVSIDPEVHRKIKLMIPNFSAWIENKAIEFVHGSDEKSILAFKLYKKYGLIPTDVPFDGSRIETVKGNHVSVRALCKLMANEAVKEVVDILGEDKKQKIDEIYSIFQNRFSV